MKRAHRLYLINLLFNIIIIVISFTNAQSDPSDTAVDEQRVHLKHDGELDLEAIRDTIRKLNLQFSVSENAFTNMRVGQRQRFCGAYTPDMPVLAPPAFNRQYMNMRSQLDWRNMYGGDYVSDVRDQGNCGSCWDFTAVAMMESAMMIAYNTPNIDPDYSEQFVLSCIDDSEYPSDCSGGYLHAALDFLVNTGAPTEECFPYLADDGIPCTDSCPATMELIEKIKSWSYVTTDTCDHDDIKEALVSGPVGTWFRIYDSFYAYSSGIYSAYGSTYTGDNHYVLLLGYDDDQQCWIAKNSWSEDWGEDGYFRIDYDSGCDFGLWTLMCNYSVFIDVTDEVFSAAEYAGGVACGDYDMDGDQDLYVTVIPGPGGNKLFRNDGAGGFVDATTSPLDDSVDGAGATWGDYDDDGDLDLYVAIIDDGSNTLYRNNGDGSFANVTDGPLGYVGNGVNVAWTDYDNDGDVDLYLSNYVGENRLLRNDGAGVFVDRTYGPLVGGMYDHGMAWGDYDNDGDDDVCIVNYSSYHSHNRLLRNDGDGVFVEVTSGPLGERGRANGVAWGDYDNDGDIDIYIAYANQENKLLRNEGNGLFADVTSDPLTNSDMGFGVAWGDYDNDGYLDLYLANYTTPNKLFRNEGDGTFTDVTEGPMAGDIWWNSMAAVWVDYDNDGDLDLFQAGSPNKLFRNDLESGNHWLHVDLVGTHSNSAAIGARARCVAEGMSLIREVSGGSGYCSQNSLTIEFGLGQSSLVDSLIIYWPSGIIQDSINIAVDQRIVVVEHGSMTGITEEQQPIVYSLLQSYPNPFNPMTTIRFDLPEPTVVNLRIYDITGREVAAIIGGVEYNPGQHDVIWNGRDCTGRAVPTGVYFCRLVTPNFVQTTRMTLVK